MNSKNALKVFLDRKVEEYNQPSFISSDPISVPHLFMRKQDIEIAGFFAATFAWGNRPTIIRKCRELMELMDMSPYEFCKDHGDSDLKRMLSFRHRTFNPTDLLYFISFFKSHYSTHKSLETAFKGNTMKERLSSFHKYFFSLEHVPTRTLKHVATPDRNSSCKRINMFLRWMVRNDNAGVDFGLWKSISPSELVCPLDLHVARVARKLKLLKRKQADWTAAMELTEALKKFDPRDPVKYDLALFSLGVFEKF